MLDFLHCQSVERKKKKEKKKKENSTMTTKNVLFHFYSKIERNIKWYHIILVWIQYIIGIAGEIKVIFLPLQK